FEGTLWGGDDEGVEVGRCGNCVVAGFRHFARSKGAGGDSVADRLDAKLGQFGHALLFLDPGSVAAAPLSGMIECCRADIIRSPWARRRSRAPPRGHWRAPRP